MQFIILTELLSKKPTVPAQLLVETHPSCSRSPLELTSMSELHVGKKEPAAVVIKVTKSCKNKKLNSSNHKLKVSG